MAKHNYVSLYGLVTRDPNIFKNDETGEYLRGMCPVMVVRGVRSSSDIQFKYDNPIIMSGNAEQIKKMETWRIGDMVEIKGAITTKNVIKRMSCEHCGHKNSKQGTVVFVNPIYTDIRERNQSSEQAAALLKQRNEISNIVFALGNLCNDPETYVTNKGTILTTYEIAITRKFRVQEDAADARTDYPWIKSYGAIAAADSKALKKGSLIYVDGFLQTRKIEKNCVCEQCGETFKWPDSSMEIVPYTTEYLRNYYTPEEIQSKEEEEYKLRIRKIFSEDELDHDSESHDSE